MTRLSRVLQFALQQVWAMEEGFHRKMFEVLFRHADGIKLTEEELTAVTGTDMPQREAEMRVEKGVAVIPIHGVIAHRASAVDRLSSSVGTSVEHVRRDLQAALADPAVQSIVLDVDSPGGSVAGLDELAAELRAARARKPIVAHTEGMMASAAYWLASQADQVFATRDALVGSIGVIARFLDGHRALADKGYDPVVVKSTPGKGSMQSNGTFSDADRANLQREVDTFHSMFLEAVAAGRRVTAEKAAEMGDGRVYVGREAEQHGYVDGLSSFAAALRNARSLGRAHAAAIASTPPGSAPAAITEEDEPMTEKKNDPAPAAITEPAKAPTQGATAQAAATAAAVTANEQFAEAQKNERQRVTAIMTAAADAQRELAMKLVADGTPLPEALAAINQDLRARLAQATALPSAATASLAGGNSAQVAARPAADPRIAAMPEGEERWKAEFAADPKLQAEFGELAVYAGWKRNEANLAAAKKRGADTAKD